jgi:hypothetical protein
MGTWLQQSVWGALLYVFEKGTHDLSSEIWTFFSGFFAFPVAVVDYPLIQRLIQFAVVISLAYLPAAIGVQVLKQIFDRADGSARSAPEELVRRIMVTGLAVTGTSTVAWFMLTLSNLVREALTGIASHTNILSIFFITQMNGLTLVMLFLQILFVIGAIVLMIQRAILTAELTVLLVTGPIMAAGLIREGGGATWNVWVRELTSILVTPLIQFLVTILFINVLLDPTGDLTIWQQVAGLAYLYVLFNTPRWARQMVYQTGTGSALVGGAVQAGRMVVLRKLVTKGV